MSTAVLKVSAEQVAAMSLVELVPEGVPLTEDLLAIINEIAFTPTKSHRAIKMEMFARMIVTFAPGATGAAARWRDALVSALETAPEVAKYEVALILFRAEEEGRQQASALRNNAAREIQYRTHCLNTQEREIAERERKVKEREEALASAWAEEQAYRDYLTAHYERHGGISRSTPLAIEAALAGHFGRPFPDIRFGGPGAQ